MRQGGSVRPAPDTATAGGHMLSMKTIRLRARGSRRGFTLVETALAIVLIVVAIVPIFSLFLASRTLDMQAKIQAAAYDVARQQLETLRAQSFTNRLAVSSASFTIPAPIAAQYPNYSLTGDYNIVNYNGSFPVQQQIVVRVRWTRPGQSSTVKSQIVLNTLIAQGAGT
jgi:type II secretory pathway pseudopilin PulG